MKLTEILSSRNEGGREADFSHIPLEEVMEFIELNLKEKLSQEEAKRLKEIQGKIRYKPRTKKPIPPQPPRGEHESLMDYLERVISSKGLP